MAITNFRRCNAILQCSLKRGQTPTQCSFKAKWGSDYCGRHRNFVATAATPPPPPPVAPPPDDTDCSICMDAIGGGNRTPFTMTPCKHYYHTRCLEKWKARSNICPCCRASLTTGANQTESDRRVATNRYIPPELTNTRVTFTPFMPRGLPRHQVAPPRPVTIPPHRLDVPLFAPLDIDQVRFMRDTVDRGSYEHGYYSAMYQSMLVN